MRVVLSPIYQFIMGSNAGPMDLAWWYSPTHMTMLVSRPRVFRLPATTKQIVQGINCTKWSEIVPNWLRHV